MLQKMGLNEFVSLLYGSSQSLNANKDATTSNTYSLPTVADWKEFQQMLKNHKNVQAKKYGYKDYHHPPPEVKYGKIYTGIGSAGGGGGGVGSGGGGAVGKGDCPEGGIKKLLNNNSSTQNNNNTMAKTSRIPTTTSKSMTSSASSSGSSELDIFRSYTKKSIKSSLTSSTPSSSFLWNSFRMPRKQKSSLAEKKRSGESLRSGVDQTELQELNNGQSSSGCPTPPMARDSKRSSIGNELPCETEAKLKRCEDQSGIVPQQEPQASKAAAPLPPMKPQDSEVKAVSFTTANEPTALSLSNEVAPSISSMTMMATPRVDIAAQYPVLKPFADDGVLDGARLAKFLEDNQLERREEHRQVLGLAVMVQFMTQELDAFACKETKEQCARTKGALEETIRLLQQTQRDCEQLREDLHAKDVEWAAREQERDHLHRTELKQAEEKVLEVQMLAKQRFCDLESQLRAKDEESKQAQQAYHMEVSHKLTLKQEHLTTAEHKILELQTRLQKLEAQEQENREKLIRKENTHAARLSEANQREQELSDRVRSLTKELTTLKANKEHNERDLRDRLALSQDEISVLRTSSQRRSPCSSLPDPASAELSRLTSEADSLRCVLELKQAEISSLSKAKSDLIRESEERLKLGNRVALLEAQNEMLRTELEAKTEKEKDMQQKMEELQKAYKYESIKRTRLTFDKEELQYHLKQRSVQLQAAEAKLLDRSTSYHDNSRCSLGRSGLDIAVTTSSPTSPVMKGMIERNDSVSWTLEIDDESSFKGNTSKIVRRAGSLRSSNERCPIQRRQTLSTNGHSNGVATNGGSSPAHPNPLSQSMSATALLRSSSHSGETEGRPLSRARSHSVCIKASASSSAVCESSGQRQRQQDELNLPDWHEDTPLCSSSPQAAGAEMRPRSSTMKLMSSEAKKFQEIQESAGEAMVSGANSEDESCSASSEDMMRSSSASSTASGGSLSKRPKQPPSRMSIEEALPCTPMEVSWSEDAADANGLA
ncbi:myosin heavy chain, muscle isoform X2 [Drosophila subpulchrella]|uniref:myosin heavy chain, muscle isoform X2 n=1 Tax=Drosophila subpulchrella TaxID=1486046 RepID=UPI0018A1A951|nr:myosin heavy chain, muscle isoform X2 [Drosophila subpulchrella]